MSELNVKATINQNDYPLNETSKDLYEVSMTTPDESTEVSVSALDLNGNESIETTSLTVISKWSTPKTDWEATDYFNYWDYNRILNNLVYLKALANKLWTPFDLDYLGKEKGYESEFYASTFNNLENALDTINKKTFNYDIGTTKTYVPNGNTFDYAELNRIESAILTLYQNLLAQKNARNVLKFRLGMMKGLKV